MIDYGIQDKKYNKFKIKVWYIRKILLAIKNKIFIDSLIVNRIPWIQFFILNIQSK
jgi:hypothetical protein